MGVVVGMAGLLMASRFLESSHILGVMLVPRLLRPFAEFPC